MLFFCFADLYGVFAAHFAVEGGDCGLGLGVVFHDDEAEAFALAGLMVGDDICLFNSSEYGKQQF